MKNIKIKLKHRIVFFITDVFTFSGNMSNILGIRRSPLSGKTEMHQSSSSGFTSRNRDNIHYLKQLLQDKKSMTSLASVFTHSERLLDEGYFCLVELLILYVNKLCLLKSRDN